MGWFDKWLARKVRKGLNQQKQEEERAIHVLSKEHYNVVGSMTKGNDTIDSFPDLNFKMFKAENGWVMEVRHTDKRTDRHTMNIHLIVDGEDLGDSIAKIITLEALRG